MSNSSSILAYSLTTLVGLGGALQGSGRGYGGTDAQNRAPRKAECGPQGILCPGPQRRRQGGRTAGGHPFQAGSFGGAALGNSEERLIQAMADIEAFNDRVQRLEQSIRQALRSHPCLHETSHIRRCERQDGCGEFSAPCWNPFWDTGNSPCEMAREPWRKPRCSALIPNPEWWC